MKKAATKIRSKTKPARLCSRIRAVLETDKESRYQDFLAAGSRLYSVNDFEDISVSSICQEAGLAKGTFYLYFETKEDLFLELTLSLMTTWSDKINVALSALGKNPAPTSFAKALAESFRPLPQLPRLLQMLHSILERNASEEAILRFKTTLAENNAIQTDLVSKMYPKISPEKIQLLMLFCQVALIGTWQFANPPPRVRAILEKKGFERFLFDYETAILSQVSVFLTGLN
jgi:AcrR family transcriptional regulator